MDDHPSNTFVMYVGSGRPAYVAGGCQPKGRAIYLTNGGVLTNWGSLCNSLMSFVLTQAREHEETRRVHTYGM